MKKIGFLILLSSFATQGYAIGHAKGIEGDGNNGRPKPSVAPIPLTLSTDEHYNAWKERQKQRRAALEKKREKSAFLRELHNSKDSKARTAEDVHSDVLGIPNLKLAKEARARYNARPPIFPSSQIEAKNIHPIKKGPTVLTRRAGTADPALQIRQQTKRVRKMENFGRMTGNSLSTPPASPAKMTSSSLARF